MEIRTVYRQMDRLITENRQSKKLIAAFTSGELKVFNQMVLYSKSFTYYVSF